jgi:26S proteasome regulatory subunit N2
MNEYSIEFSSLTFLYFSSESLYENETFKYRELAALVSSKVYYHLGSLDNALTYALGAGDLFDVNDKTEYVETIIGE